VSINLENENAVIKKERKTFLKNVDEKCSDVLRIKTSSYDFVT
jgi:hypothetical protein